MVILSGYMISEYTEANHPEVCVKTSLKQQMLYLELAAIIFKYSTYLVAEASESGIFCDNLLFSKNMPSSPKIKHLSKKKPRTYCLNHVLI